MYFHITFQRIENQKVIFKSSTKLGINFNFYLKIDVFIFFLSNFFISDRKSSFSSFYSIKMKREIAREYYVFKRMNATIAN